MGLVHHHAADTPARQNSTLNVSRPCFLKKGLVTLSVNQPFHMPYVVTEGLKLAGAYLPILRAKHPYWERLAPWAKRHRKAPCWLPAILIRENISWMNRGRDR